MNDSGEVLFEYTQFGNSVRVIAIDAATGTEVTLQAPIALSRMDMQTLALRKLNYVLRKQKQKKKPKKR
jgi:uncharacterized protein DUF6898